MNRIGIFCDVQSLWYNAKVWSERRVDYSKLRRVLIDGRFVSCCYAYMTMRGGISSFNKALQHMGYDTVCLGRGELVGENIAAKVLERCDEFDTAVIATGEGNYGSVITKLQDLGKRVEIRAFPVACPITELSSKADRWIPLTADVLEEFASRAS